MAGTHALNNSLQTPPILLLVQLRNSPNLRIIPTAQNLTDKQLIRPRLPLRRLIQLQHIRLHLLRHNRRTTLGPRPRNNHQEMPLRLHTQLTLQIILQVPPISLVILLFNSRNISITPPQQNIIKRLLIRPRPRHPLPQHMTILQQRPPHDSKQHLLQVPAALVSDIVDQIAGVLLLVRGAQDVDLQRVLGDEHVD